MIIYLKSEMNWSPACINYWLTGQKKYPRVESKVRVLAIPAIKDRVVQGA
jgi:hypothetical protein